MTYQSLARKYRPGTLKELLGQDAVTIALANAIKLGREPHGVIFAGVRGIGKTTLARVYAKALNCEKGPSADPCNVCESCRAVTDGCHEDVLEIDGASNTGVDDVRILRETVGYVPQRSKFKVYIIDEVHMLSQSAFNALLKTLEEPPPHVVFIFATTELQKIPETIISRCQTFHLQKFSVATVQKRLSEILIAENISFENAALNKIAREGRGSMRDSLTILDQAIALGEGKVTQSSLMTMFGGLSTAIYLDLLSAVVAKNSGEILKLVGKVNDAGVEFSTVAEQLAKFARDAFIIRDVGKSYLDLGFFSLDESEIERLADIGQKAAPFDLNRIFRSLVRCHLELDGSELDRMILENYLMEWCFDPGFPELNSTNIEKPRELTKLHAKTIQNPGPAPAPVSAHVPVSTPAPASAPVTPSVPKTPSFPATWRELVDAWKHLKPLQARLLEETSLLAYSQEEIKIAVNENSMAADKLLQKPIQQKIQETFAELFLFKGKFVAVKKAPEVTGATPILEEKNKERQKKKEDLIHQLTEDPFTKEVIQTFGARIESINVER